MPTLIGTEAPFTFQNLNISRGLLFNQENTINQGVQVNYANGPWSASVAGTDGFFSGQISWLSGAITYKIDNSNTVGINGGLNVDRTNVLTGPAPLTVVVQQLSGRDPLAQRKASTWAHAPTRPPPQNRRCRRRESGTHSSRYRVRWS